MNVIIKHRFMSIILVGILSFLGSWMVSTYKGIPVPYIHDEYSYLLAADTFAHGRITNPTHPLWLHFQTFHELMKPSYMSKYPPGQGFFLAIGQVLFGHPVYGVWLSAGLMCSAICWMLYGWMPSQWAFLGGLVAVMQFGVFTYWSQSYWGGAVAGIGGALVFGALPRIFNKQRLRDAIWLGLGVAIILNTRPLEGILVGIPIGCLVLPWKIKWKSIFLDRFFKNVIFPFSVILLITVLGMGLYNKKITGSAFEFPHRLYSKQNTTVPLLIWQSEDTKNIEFHNKPFYDYERANRGYYLYKRTWDGFVYYFKEDISRMFLFFFGYPLAVPAVCICLCLFWYRRRLLFFLIAILIFLMTCVSMDCLGARPHYFATMTALVVMIITAGFRYIVLRYRFLNIGSIVMIFLFSIQLILNVFTSRTFYSRSYASFQDNTGSNSFLDLPKKFNREQFKNFLLKIPGKHLVLIEYNPEHNISWEWVYNAADIDHAPIVWARSLDEGHNRQLLAYYKDRKVWKVKVWLDIISLKGHRYRYDER